MTTETAILSDAILSEMNAGPYGDEYWKTQMARIAAGSESALESCYRHFGPMIHRFLLSRGCSEEVSMQILNETMMELWRGAAAAFEGRARISTWILGIAHHRMVDHIRREARHDADQLDERLDLEISDEPEPEHQTELQLEQDRLQECLEQLPGELRQLCYLVFFEELPYSDIARILDCPEGTVKSRVFNARKRLRACLGHALTN